MRSYDLEAIKGDDLFFTLNIYDDVGEVYEPVDGDEIRFQMGIEGSRDIPVFRINVPLSDMTVHIPSTVTNQFVAPTRCSYDVDITHGDGTRQTFIRGTITFLRKVE